MFFLNSLYKGHSCLKVNTCYKLVGSFITLHFNLLLLAITWYGSRVVYWGYILKLWTSRDDA